MHNLTASIPVVFLSTCPQAKATYGCALITMYRKVSDKVPLPEAAASYAQNVTFCSDFNWFAQSDFCVAAFFIS